MATLPHWDETETALLIEAYLRVQDGKISRKAAVAELSKLLREHAIQAGAIIDSTYRNENGVAWQLSNIERLMQNRPNAEAHNTRVFIEMVALYREDPERFQTILANAKGEETKMEQRSFLQWLVAEEKKHELADLQQAYADTEAYAKKEGVVKESIEEIKDFEKLDRLSEILAEDRMFRWFRNKQAQHVSEIIRKIKIFLDETDRTDKEKYNIKIDASLDKQEEIESKEESVTSNSEKPDDMEETITPGKNDESHTDLLEIENTGDAEIHIDPISNEEKNLSESAEGEDVEKGVAQPKEEDNNSGIEEIRDPLLRALDEKKIEYYDLRSKGGCLWVVGDLSLENYIKQLNKQYQVNFCFKFNGGKVTSGREAWWTSKKTGYAQAKDVGLAVNSLPPIEAAHNGEKVLDAAKNEHTANEKPDEAEIFKKWLKKQGFGLSLWRSVVQAIDKVSNMAKQYGDIEQSIYQIESHEDLESLWNKLCGYDDFEQYQQQNRIISFAFNKLLEFKWEKEQNQSNFNADTNAKPANVSKIELSKDTDSELKEKKDEFWQFLREEAKLAEATCSAVVAAVSRTSDFAVKNKIIAKTIFLIDDQEELELARSRIMNDSRFAAVDKRSNYRFSAATERYLNFRVHDRTEAFREDTQDTSKVHQIPVQTLKRDVHPGRVEFEDWMKNTNCPAGTIQTYANAIENTARFLLDAGLEERNLFAIRGIARLEKIRNELAQNPDYAKGGGTHLALYALKKYISFRKNDLADETSGDVAEAFAHILCENFENGFRPNSIIDRNRFRQYYAERYGEEPPQNDEEIVQLLQKIGTLQDNRIFAREGTTQSDLLDDILAEIALAFKNGASCVYYSEIYKRYQNELASQLQVFSQNVLKELLISASYSEYRTGKHYFYLDNRKPSADDDVRKLMRQSPVPLNYSSIHEQLWYIPLDTIKHSLVTISEIVNVAQETYFYAPNLPISVEELNQIAELLHGQLVQKNYVTDIELRKLIEQRCPSVAINTEAYSTWGLRNCLAVLLMERFSFNGPIISERGHALNMDQVFKEFSRSHEVMTFEELKQFATDVNSGYIYWDSVMDVMVRTSQEEFVPKGTIKFDVQAIDEVLDEMTEGEYQPLSNYRLFLHYPPISVRWNSFVLESYVAGYSRAFALMHSSYTANECCGAIVRRDSTIKDFQGLLTDVLVNSDEWSSKNDALELLVKKGYLQRKHYTKIDTIIMDAKLQREKNQTSNKE